MDNSKVKTFRIKRSPRFNHIGLLFIAILVIFGFVGWSTNSIYKSIAEQKRLKRLAETVDFCDNLFAEKGIIKTETTRESLKDCDDRLSQIDNSEGEVKTLHEKVESSMKYLDYVDLMDEWFDEKGIVKSDIDDKDILALESSLKELSETYQSIALKKLNTIKSEHNKLKEAEKSVKNLINAKTNAKRKDYDTAKKLVDELKQEDVKSDLKKSLSDILKTIEEQEKIARERAEKARKEREERQKKIAASWHRLNIAPYYINQYSNGYPNGCEAASLLMALKYKGYARNVSFSSFADSIPSGVGDTSPYEMFYGNMKEYAPKDNLDAYWIAPSALAPYGRQYGATVIDATGWSLDQLANEIKNGNPVVFWTTWDFNNPKGRGKHGVPKNLHVVVLSGYNSYTNDFEFYDPFPGTVNGKHPTITRARTNTLYNALGKRALVVR